MINYIIKLKKRLPKNAFLLKIAIYFNMKQNELPAFIALFEQYSVYYSESKSSDDFYVFSRTWYFPSVQAKSISSILARNEQFERVMYSTRIHCVKSEYKIDDESITFTFKVSTCLELSHVVEFESNYLGKLNDIMNEVVSHTISPIEELLLKKEINTEDLFLVFDFMNQKGTEDTVVYLDWILPYINELEDRGLLFDFSENLEEPIVAIDLDDRIKFISKKEYDLMKIKETVIPELQSTVNITEGVLWLSRNYSNYLTSLEKYNHDEVQHICDYMNSLIARTDRNLTELEKEEELLKERQRNALFRISYEDMNEKAHHWVTQMNRKAALEEDGDGIDNVWDDGNFNVVKVISAQSLSREGAIMKHCVGGYGYAEQVAKGTTQIYSVRNNENKPLCTMDISKGRVNQVKGWANDKTPPEIHGVIYKFITNYLGMSLDKVNKYDLAKFGYEEINLEGSSHYLKVEEAREIRKLLPLKTPKFQTEEEYKNYVHKIEEGIGSKVDVESIISRLVSGLKICPVRNVFDHESEVDIINSIIEFSNENKELIDLFQVSVFNDILTNRAKDNSVMIHKIHTQIRKEYEVLSLSISQYQDANEYENLHTFLTNYNTFFSIVSKVELENLFILNSLNFDIKDEASFQQFVSEIIEEKINKVVNVPFYLNKIHDELAISAIKLQELKLMKLVRLDDCSNCSAGIVYKSQVEDNSIIDLAKEEIKNGARSFAGVVDIIGEILDEMDGVTYVFHNAVKEILANTFDFTGKVKNTSEAIQERTKLIDLRKIEKGFEPVIDLIDELEEDDFNVAFLSKSIDSYKRVKRLLTLDESVEKCSTCDGRDILETNKARLESNIGLNVDLNTDGYNDIRSYINEYRNLIEEISMIEFSSLVKNVVDYKKK